MSTTNTIIYRTYIFGTKTFDKTTWVEKDYWTTQKDIFKVVTPKNVIIPQEILSSTYILIPYFVDEIKNLDIHKDYEKIC